MSGCFLASCTPIITTNVLNTSEAECTASDIIAPDDAIRPASSFNSDNTRLTIMLITDTLIAMAVELSSLRLSSTVILSSPVIRAFCFFPSVTAEELLLVLYILTYFPGNYNTFREKLRFRQQYRHITAGTPGFSDVPVSLRNLLYTRHSTVKMSRYPVTESSTLPETVWLNSDRARVGIEVGDINDEAVDHTGFISGIAPCRSPPV